MRACTWCDESTQPDLAPLPNIQGPDQGDREQQQEQQQQWEQGQQWEQRRRQQQQHESELGTGAARAMHKPNLSPPIMLDPDPG